MQKAPSSVPSISKTECGAVIPLLGIILCYIRFLKLAWDIRGTAPKNKTVAATTNYKFLKILEELKEWREDDVKDFVLK